MARNTTTSTGSSGAYSSTSTTGSASATASAALDSASSTIKEGVSRAKDEAARQGSAALDGIKGGAQALGTQAKERAGEYVEGGISTVTQSLEDFAQAIRAASDELSQKDQTMAAQIVRQAAGGLESLSRSVSGTSIDDIISSVRRFGRNNPTAFIGGAVLAGLALGRFARASSHNDQDDWRQGGSGQGYSSQGGYSGEGSYSGEGGYSGHGGYSGQGGYQNRGGSQFGGRDSWSDSSSSTGGGYGSSSTGAGGGLPSQSQGYAGGGMGSGSNSTSGPSSETDESVTSSSSTGGLGSSSISTGGSS